MAVPPKVDPPIDPRVDPKRGGSSRGDLAWRSPAAWMVLLLTFVVGLSVDLSTKSWAFATVAGTPVDLPVGALLDDPHYRLPWHEGVRAVPPDLLDFHLVLNQGAVFGLGQQRRTAFIILTLVAIGAGLAVFGFWTGRRAVWSHVAIGLVLAGGVGNLHDRVLYGAVRDFLHLFPRRDLPFGWRWPGGSTEWFPWVFNVADMLLLAGMAILLVQAWRADRAERRAAALAAS